jgi:hypothetical protein
MAWVAKNSDATQLTAITETEQFFDEFPLPNPRELLNCEVEYDPPGTPTDALIVSIYRTLDDSSENWDDIPFMTFTIPNAPDPAKLSFDIMGTYKFRIGVKMDGSTDVTGVADFSYRSDGVNA